uniref:Nucleoside diphosphate kinase n=1 Tax=Pundamilia nyererei TaxID=303518 RepID=A0A3B4FGF2_9CICH
MCAVFVIHTVCLICPSVEIPETKICLVPVPACSWCAAELDVSVLCSNILAHFDALHQRILDNNFGIVRCKDLVWRRQDSERFYAEHSGRFFYQRLVEFMSSGPMRAYILAREDAISHWRELMGPTKVFRARFNSPASIRGQFGLTDTRNTTHGSDSLESAQREITFFFPDFCADEWMKKEEPLFRSGQIRYDHQNQIHTLSLSIKHTS